MLVIYSVEFKPTAIIDVGLARVEKVISSQNPNNIINLLKERPMNQSMKIHKLSIRNTKDGISTGANTEVLLDGKPLKAVRFIKIECSSTKAVKVVIEMYVNLDEVDVNIEDLKLSEVTNLDTKEVRSIGKFTPVVK